MMTVEGLIVIVLMIVSAFAIGYLVGIRKPRQPRAIPPTRSSESPDVPHTPKHTADGPVVVSPPSIVEFDTAHPTDQLLHQRLGALDISTIEIQHTPDWDHALELAEGETKCLFITGVAGTGKSTLLRYFVANTDKPVVVLAPTGVAALNVGGQTIHSFFRFPPGPINKIEEIPFRGELFKAIKAIIIDEISMVRADLLDAIDESLRVNCKEPSLPFGGIQMLFIGDLFQLQPVVREREEGQFFSQYYASPFFFDSNVLSSIQMSMFRLRTVYRQTDPVFMGVLNRIRINRMRESDLVLLNSRVLPNFEPPSGQGYIELTTTNRMAEIKNAHELQKLPMPECEYHATVIGRFRENQYPTDLVLRLRVGAQVMLIVNDVGRRWVNGTVAIVEELDEDTVTVRIPTPAGQPDRICQVSSNTWDISEYRINHQSRRLESDIVGSFTQLPIKLAWSITIHKSQGKTLDRAIIDMSQGTFANGQAYVALSRCATLDGLILRSPFRKRDVKVDPRVFGFIDAISRKSVIVE